MPGGHAEVDIDEGTGAIAVSDKVEIEKFATNSASYVAESSFSMTIVSDSSSGNKFGISSSTSGQVELRSQQQLTFGDGPFAVVVRYDVNGATADCTLKINVVNVNSAPRMQTLPSLKIVEQSKSGSVVQAFVNSVWGNFDILPYVQDSDPNEQFSFEIIASGNNNKYLDASNGDAIFNIGSCSGIVTVSDATIRYSETQSLRVNMWVKDELGAKDEFQITVTVEDINDPPRFLKGGVDVDEVAVAVPEDSTLNAVISTALTVVDPENGALTYTLSGSDIFKMAANSGPNIAIANIT